VSRTVSTAELRRRAVAAQGYASRTRRGRPAEVAAAVDRLGCVQLDSISTVGRAHRLTLGSRIGAYPETTVSRLLKGGRIFEYWAHEACLVPIEDYPLFKRRMEHLRERHWWGRKHDHDPELKERVLDALRANGALPTRFFEGGGGGGMWNWKPEKRILEDLFAAGEVVVAGRDGFQRLYDLPERVIPREQLEAPAPSEEEFQRGYALRAVHGRGAIGASRYCGWSCCTSPDREHPLLDRSPVFIIGRQGLVGLINTLSQEGAKYNIKANAVAPIAATRMTQDILPPEVFEKLTPEYVAPVVAYLCTEEVPDTASVFIVGGGKVQRVALFQNSGVTFAEVPSVDDVAGKWGEITDLSAAERANFSVG